jgi:plasmid stabilization system protein ParE
MSFQVELSRRAEGDLDRILAWIAERSPQGARNWLTRWEEVLALLSDRAESCLLAPENEDHVEQIRHVVFKTHDGKKYRALFVIRGQRVFITNLRGPGQDLVPPNQLSGPNN